MRNQEEKIREMEQKIEDIERTVCKTACALKMMSVSIEPMFLEWRKNKDEKAGEIEEALYG